MDPTRDNLQIRFKAFIDGLGIFTIFAVILLIILGGASIFGWFPKGEEPEDAAGKIRSGIKSEVSAEQAKFLTEDAVDAVTPNVAQLLSKSNPIAVEVPAQLVPGSETEKKLAAEVPIDPAQMEIGKAQYLICGACHGQNGEGGPAGPPLAGSEWVTGPISNLIKIQLRGLTGPIEVKGKVYDQFPAGMLPMAYQTDEQIAGALTYVRNSFGNKASAVKPEEVKALRDEVGKPQLTVQDLIKP
ncbi:MAG: c-type cytochrome [Akkermansiaceae bacterium]|jgi:mono/diheme cytochrome c family protein|nr:cytochrome c [Luteolibacter sp.]